MSLKQTYTEAELVVLLKKRNNSSYDYLYDHYSGALYSIILQIVQDENIAADVLQEVFVNIWKKIDSYDETKGRLFTWMLNIARNAAIDMIRSKTYRNSNRSVSLDGNADNLQSTQLQVDGIGLRRAVDKLKPEQRSLIELAYFLGYTHEEIAEIEAIPLGTVKTRIRAALQQLRTFLK
ncbi:RNA polymerase sigma factor [Pinibacter soli]|uniref:Sigma-70 family RNA polymerase sigma factor n=1 Tax=Pinibacter soli TaxID=3044211 RepID=A0ABT6RCZ9_9BACT|nr:sigma-70 family RNA polymerase sigma factor [Pinibacter soli]MDI3320271.1 sigma-70 family RNA polymerase sigma factor [Pinibacter soli]